MSKKDFYELLEVDRSADDKTLKSAYRKKAMKYHPDRNPGDEEAEAKFKEINEAYDVLKDAEKRAAYDQYGHAAFEGGMGGGRGGFGGQEGFDFGDIFEEFFGGGMGGGGRRRRGPGGQSATRGSDLRYNMEISLEDAFSGKQEQITVPTSESCGECSGSGAEKGSQPEVCGTCGGHGKVRASQGFFMVERTCHSCGGQGMIIKNPCRPCSGAGRISKEKTLEVNIPKGVEDGTRLRIGGSGEAGLRGGPTGDLYIFLSVQPHQIFKRDAEMLFCEVPIPMTTAALGGKIEVPTIGGGRVSVKVPEGTQSGRQFRLRGKGMPALNSGGFVGDMILEAAVETPTNLSSAQREILEEFAREGGDEVSPQTKGFFDKVKDLFVD
ncbi:molecular chaperone DnaJ [Temperatibacter marinus]|uniref:Chaperone protein DnaJ n=1 Tax=Temperatibacter marinus TaxID=1456591 RepID=A0AA52HA65_9PROT|nr:molecular chaperone DnaJ [Temperatibacter marinus]WND03654.1 molecular chaperone DnaJ [Temperatibacter marinus]